MGMGPGVSTAHGSKRGERFLALLGLVVAGAVPAYLYRSLLADLSEGFSLDFGYLAFGISGFVLIALGLVIALPVVLSIGRDPESRLYPRSRSALAGWGTSLYLLGTFLVIQIGAIAETF
jgi:hypothetical protein